MEWRHTVWPEAKLVYTAIAKVANTSIKSALLESFEPEESRRNPHSPDLGYSTVKPNRIGVQYPDYCHFAVVRNPFDRLVSFWADKIDGDGMTDGLRKMGFAEKMSFADAARLACTIPDEDADPHFRSQSFLVLGDNGRPRTDLLLRFEHLAADWAMLARIVTHSTGAELKLLPHRRTSEHQSFDHYFDDALVELVVARYEADFAELCYPTEPGLRPEPQRLRSDDPVRAALAQQPRANVIDLAGPDVSRAEAVESGGGVYLAPAHESHLGQLSRFTALEQGRIPLDTFDLVVVAERDAKGRQPHTWLVDEFAAAGKTTIRLSDDAAPAPAPRPRRAWRRTASKSAVGAGLAEALDAEPSPPRRGRYANERLATLAEVFGSASTHDLAAARVALRVLELEQDKHYFNAARPLDQLLSYVDVAGELFATEELGAGPVLEFGSGTRNSLSVGALLYANGAAEVVCYEPGKVNMAQTGIALRQLLVDMIRDPARFVVADADPEQVEARAVRLLRTDADDANPPLRLCSSIDGIEQLGRRFRLTLSNHVMEHVADPQMELARLAQWSTDDARQLHRVDFRDHRFFQAAHRAGGVFAFYRDGELTTCNGMRPSDVEADIEAAGWRHERRRVMQIDEKDVPEPQAKRFRAYPVEELAVTEVDYLLTR